MMDRCSDLGRDALRPEPKATYGIICRACAKPNAPTVTFCTGCSFPASEWDLQRLPDNIFLELVNGKDIGAKVHYRDKEFIVFDDKFGVSSNHLDVIPTVVYADLTSLTSAEIPMLERLYELGKQEFLRRRLSLFANFQRDQHSSGAAADDGLPPFDIDTMIVAGYNFPVSVKHLHLHMVLPPFTHEKVFQYPRWHPHAKVISDLKKYGCVHTYAEFPDDAAGEATYDEAIAHHRLVMDRRARQAAAQGAAPPVGNGPAKS